MSHYRRSLVLLIIAVPFILAAIFAVVVYAPAFGDYRRAQAVRVLSALLELPIAVDGDIDLVIASPLKLRISKVQIGGASGSEPRRAQPVDLVELSFPLWPALTGNFEVSELIVAGGRLELTGKAGDGMSAAGIARLPSGFLNARISDHLEFRDIAIHYRDTSGWEFEWAIENFISRQAADGGQIALDSQGALNGLHYSLSGRFANPRGGVGGNVPSPFSLAADFSGLKASLGGSLDISSPIAILDARIEIAADSLTALLQLFRLENEMVGKGTLDAKLTGPLDSIRAERIALGLSDSRGRTLQLNGGIADLGTGEGVDMSFSADLTGDGLRHGKPVPVAEIDLTGFQGEIVGSLDRLVVKQIFIFTNVTATELKQIGPISLGRVVRDPDGRLGFLDIRILEGPADDPVFDLSGEIADVLDFSRIVLAGGFNVSLAGLLLPQPGPKPNRLGRLKGSFAVSDSSGSLRLEEFQAVLRDTKLISLTVRKSGTQEAPTEGLVLEIDLDIPDFSAVAARLGGEAKTGAAGFTGELAFRDRLASLRGEANVGRTVFTLEGSLGYKDGAPFASANIATKLLYMADIERAAQVYTVYAATENDSIEVDLEENFVRQAHADIDIRVAELDANGKKAGNIHAQGRYKNGIVVFDPFRMSYLEGTVDARVRANTNNSPSSVAIEGEIDGLDMGRLLASLELTPWVTGALDSTFDLSISMSDRIAISKSLNGKLDVAIWGGALASRTIDLGGQNVVRWMFSGSGEAKLVCATASLDFSDGKGKAKSIVIETDNVKIVGAGDIDIAANSIALSFETRAKRPELIDVAMPFSVGGKLTEPVVEISSAVKIGRVAKETLTLPLNVLRLLLPLARSGEAQRPCAVESTPYTKLR